ncbi:2494_t:CDS:1, partial [Racocetra fulgida]
SAFQTTPLNIIQWLTCIGLGGLSLPVGVIIRLLPIEKLFSYKQSKAHTIRDDESAVTSWQKQLKFFKALRGGGRFRSHFGPVAKNQQAFAGVAVVPSLMVSAVGVPLSTRDRSQERDNSKVSQRSIPGPIPTPRQETDESNKS